MNAKNLKPDKYAFTLFVGDSNSGKTCAANCFPGKCYNFVLDHRIHGILDHPVTKAKAEAGEIEYDFYEVQDKGYFDIASRLETFINQAERRQLPFKNIIFDGMTAYQDFTLYDSYRWVDIVSQKGNERVKLWGPSNLNAEKRLKGGGFDPFAYQHAAFKELLGWLRLLSEHGVNVIVCAHWCDQFDEDGNVVGKDINLRPKLAKSFYTTFNDVYYFERRFVGGRDKGENKFVVVFRNELARTTITSLPNKLDWTNKDFYKVLMEHINDNQET